MVTNAHKKSIKKLTLHSYESIMKMTDKQFFSSITTLFNFNKINRKQHDWLLDQRLVYDIDDFTKDILKIFGGKVIRERNN